MGAFSNERGQRHLLRSDHLIGRAPDSALQLADTSVSWRHASVRWTGRGWELQDLGSLNGTFYDGSRIEKGARVLLRAGARLRFGAGGGEWLVADVEPPEVFVTNLEDGSYIRAENGLVVLPNSEAPELSIHRTLEGHWLAEGPDRIWELQPDELLVVSGQRYRFEPGDALHATAVGVSGAPTPAALALEFVVSRNEEHVELSIMHAGQRTSLRPRAHTYLLLTLARLRLSDQGDASLPPTSHGWVEQQRLLRLLNTNLPQLTLDIYRARRQFSEAGVIDAAQLIERRAVSRELRIGAERLSIAVH